MLHLHHSFGRARRAGGPGGGLLLASLILLVLPACDSTTAVSDPAAFDRPENVVFFCWNLNGNEGRGAPAPLEQCGPVPPAAGEEDLGQPTDGFALHALVTQTTTGEVAAVRVTGRDGAAGVIDSDVRVPGFTFVAVGDVPSGIAISRRDPTHAFVVSRGSNLISIIATPDFRVGTGATVQSYDQLPAGSRPSDMILSPEEDALLVALPTRGEIAKIPILGAGMLGPPELLALAATVPEPVDLSGLAQDQLPPEYAYTCRVVAQQPPPIPPRLPTSLGVVAEPWSLLIDPETGEVLVSDRSLPIVHRIDPVAFVEGAPISVSVPTRALALTPRVPTPVNPGFPTMPGDSEPTERFLYAIDEIDESVLAIDYTDPARASYGGVLTVSATPPLDRLELPTPARALVVVSPEYDDSEPAGYCTDADGGANARGDKLSGVFLAVGTLDGVIRFFDVFDADAPCRGADQPGLPECGNGINQNVDDVVVAIGRHRPRLRSPITEGIRVTGSPSWSTSTLGTLIVDAAGETVNGSDIVPDLAPVTCEGTLSEVFPLSAGEPARICAVRDPWAASNERFTITYEGRLPFSGSSGANFDFAGGAFLESRSDYCALGVLGAEDSPTEGYLAGYPGDVVVITGDLPRSILDGDEVLRSRCEELTRRTTGGDITPVEIAIERAFSEPPGIRETYTGRLQLGEVVEPAGASLATVAECYPELLQVEIRARGAFVVDSSIDGFQHPVVRADDGSCTVDPVLAATRRGRAFYGELYTSPSVRFALGPQPSALEDTTLDFGIGLVPSRVGVTVGTIGGTDRPSLLTTLVYNDVDERLYAIDQAIQGLVRIRLAGDLEVQQTFR